MSAAFILISSKVGDLIGRKRAYVLGLLAYAIGALAMTLAQNLTAIIIFCEFWLVARRPVADHGLGAWPPRIAAEQLHPFPDRGRAGERGSRSELGGRILWALVRTGDGRRHHARRPRLLVHLPVFASLLGLLNAFRMRRLPDPTPASSTEGVALG